MADRKDQKRDAVNLDMVLEKTGPYGKFQWLLQFVCFVLVIAIGHYQVNVYFLGNDPSWKCNSKNESSTFCVQNNNKVISSDSKDFYERCHLNRTEWMYTVSTEFSFVTEFDLICSRTWMAALTTGAFYIGGLFGSLPAGIIADKYGRKIVMVIVTIFITLSSISCSQVANHWQLLLLRIILGGSQMVCYSIGFVYLSEFMAPKYRTVSGVVYQAVFCLSELLITVLAFVEQKWRHLQLYVSFPCIVPLVLLVFLPNSPRWLLQKGKTQDACKVLQKVAKYNKKSFRDIDLESEKSNVDKHDYTYMDLFRKWRICLLTCLLAYNWTIVALLYFAIALESSNLGGNMYQAFALTAFADFPSYFATWYACDKFGRKRSVLGGLVGAGLFIGACALVPQSFKYKYIVNIILAMIAKFLTNFSFSGIFVWTFEVFPTCIRSQGFSFCIATERIGAFGAPFLISLLRSINYTLPYIVLLVTSLLCGLTGLVLPETLNMETRETFDDFAVVSNVVETEEDIGTKTAVVGDVEMSSVNQGAHLEKCLQYD